MSDGMLEIRKTYKADGTIENAYRIGTRDWVTLSSLEHSYFAEQADGSFARLKGDDNRLLQGHYEGRWMRALGLDFNAHAEVDQ